MLWHPREALYLDIFTSAGLAPNNDPYLTGYFINVVCQRPFSNANGMSCFERLSPRLEEERTPLNARLPATQKECLESYHPPIIRNQKQERINRYHRLLNSILQNVSQALLRECHSSRHAFQSSQTHIVTRQNKTIDCLKR